MSADRRKEELEKKRKKLEELRKAREERKKTEESPPEKPVEAEVVYIYTYIYI